MFYEKTLIMFTLALITLKAALNVTWNWIYVLIPAGIWFVGLVIRSTVEVYEENRYKVPKGALVFWCIISDLVIFGLVYIIVECVL